MHTIFVYLVYKDIIDMITNACVIDRASITSGNTYPQSVSLKPRCPEMSFISQYLTNPLLQKRLLPVCANRWHGKDAIDKMKHLHTKHYRFTDMYCDRRLQKYFSGIYYRKVFVKMNWFYKEKHISNSKVLIWQYLS